MDFKSFTSIAMIHRKLWGVKEIQAGISGTRKKTKKDSSSSKEEKGGERGYEGKDLHKILDFTCSSKDELNPHFKDESVAMTSETPTMTDMTSS